MSIDAEMQNGVITEAQAIRKKKNFKKEADFYGSMDGASKFVRGDAIAGIIITVVNVIGGILIGFFQKDMLISDALQTYTILSIGDGLVTQIPSIIVSIAAGILVTRSSEEANLGEFVGKQLVVYPKAMAISGSLLLLFSIFLSETFGLFSFLRSDVLQVLTFFTGNLMIHQKFKRFQSNYPCKITIHRNLRVLPHLLMNHLIMHYRQLRKLLSRKFLHLRWGTDCLYLQIKKKGGDLLDRITGARTNFAKEMGMLLPTIGVRDSIELEPNEYRFLLRGKELERSSVVPDRFMAMNMGEGDVSKLGGIPCIEPVFGIKASWVDEEQKRKAEVEGCTVVDPSSVLVTHLSDVLKKNAHLILEREGTQRLIDLVKDKNPTLVSELLPDLVSVGVIQRTLQNLLREKVSIKNFTLILETIADVANLTKLPDDLAEQARKRLGMYFVKEFEAEPNKLLALTLESSLEQTLISRVKKSQFDIGLAMDPELTQNFLQELEPKISEMSSKGLTPILLTTAELRLALRRFLEPSIPQLVVLAYQELPSETLVEPYGFITLPNNSLPEEIVQQMEQPQETPITRRSFHNQFRFLMKETISTESGKEISPCC